MKEIISYIIGVLACSGILLIVYGLLLERRVPFRICRAYLPLAMVAAIVIPLLDIPVWEGATVYVTPTATVGEITAEMIDDTPAVDARSIVAAIYLLGVALSLLLMLHQFMVLRRIRRRGTLLGDTRPRIVRAAENISSFSFFGTIYIGRDTDYQQMHAILVHERSHIAHRHSAERMLMELLKAAMWWNPFAWIAQRRLVEVHEYEADADVLGRGYDIDNYISAILKSLLGYSPDIANGLRDSLTKKRFKMMTTKRSGRYALLRTSAVIPVLAGLLCTFSFTAKATRYVTADAAAIGVATPQLQTTPDDDPDLMVEKMPTFQGGDLNKFRQWVNANIKYPEQAQTAQAQGTVLISFVVEPDGTVGSCEVVQSPAKSLSDECLRVVKSSPRWEAGMHEGKKVRVKFNLPIVFKVEEAAPATTEKPAARSDGDRQAAEQAFFEASQRASSESDATPDSKSYIKVDKMPSFRGGDLNTFRQWVMSQVKYPADALAKKISGRVVVSFVVDKDGKVTEPCLLQSPDRMLSDEVFRVLGESPAWMPGQKDGEAVRVKYTLPVEFRIPGTVTANSHGNPSADNSVEEVVVTGFGA